MKARHRLFRRAGVYYAHDGDTRRQRSLGTRDKIIGELQALFARHNAGAALSAKAVFKIRATRACGIFTSAG